jgi:hypothetical protein
VQSNKIYRWVHLDRFTIILSRDRFTCKMHYKYAKHRRRGKWREGAGGPGTDFPIPWSCRYSSLNRQDCRHEAACNTNTVCNSLCACLDKGSVNKQQFLSKWNIQALQMRETAIRAVSEVSGVKL